MTFCVWLLLILGVITRMRLIVLIQSIWGTEGDFLCVVVTGRSKFC